MELTMKEYRRAEKAWHKRQQRDLATRLQKLRSCADHEHVYEELCSWLRQMPQYRAPHVKDNLFALSDFLSGRPDAPKQDVLKFLHAYIFALENTVFYQHQEIGRLRKTQVPEFLRSIKHRRTPAEGEKEKA